MIKKRHKLVPPPTNSHFDPNIFTQNHIFSGKMKILGSHKVQQASQPWVTETICSLLSGVEWKPIPQKSRVKASGTTISLPWR